MEGFWTGFFAGIVSWMFLMWLLKQFLVWLVLKVASKQIAKIKEEEGKIMLKVEKHGDMIYCYRKDNDEFIGQAKTLEELADIFKKKYPNNDGHILKEDAAGVTP